MVHSPLKLQSATEYLLTYGWAFLIAAIVVASLYLFVFAPSTIAPSSCTFYSGVFCQDLILGSSATLSKMAMLLTNSNPYPIINPSITVNITGIAPISGSCVPNFVLPGGAIICSATISPALPQGALASGRFIFSYTPCPGGNVVSCSGNARQSYTGSYNTHVSPLLSPTDITITLTAQNASQVAINTSLDKLTANVKLLGTVLSGATVNFTSNSVNAAPNPLTITTDGSGNAVSYISSSVSGNVFVSASFANQSANTIIVFTPPICFTFSLPGLSGVSSNALTIDGVGYSSFPQQLCYGKGTSHTYSFQTTVAGAAGVQYLFGSASGCGVTAQSGTISGSSNCTLTGNYITQYFLTTSASPGAGGSVTPASAWFNAGSSTTLGETPNAGYVFNGFTGTGSGSYTGANTAPSITLNNPITQTGSFTSTTTTSTSTTSTSSTTTSIYPITYNPGSGNYIGDVIYSSSTQLTGNVLATNMISVSGGVTLDVCGHYIEANVLLNNPGTITSTCASATHTSYLFGVSLSSGASGSSGSNGANGGGGGTVGGTGGSGGAGGGIVEIYASNIVNAGSINANGNSGNSGGNGAATDAQHASGGGGGGGAGGHGGTVLVAYTVLSGAGVIQSSGGGGGSGGTGGTVIISFDQQVGGGVGGSGSVSGGGGGGGGDGQGCCTGQGGGAGGAGAAPSGGSGGSGGAYGEGQGGHGGNAVSSNTNNGNVIVRAWP